MVEEHKVKQPKKMKTFQESEKSRKTIASLKMNQKNNKSNETHTSEGNAVENYSAPLLCLYRCKFLASIYPVLIQREVASVRTGLMILQLLLLVINH